MKQSIRTGCRLCCRLRQGIYRSIILFRCIKGRRPSVSIKQSSKTPHADTKPSFPRENYPSSIACEGGLNLQTGLHDVHFQKGRGRIAFICSRRLASREPWRRFLPDPTCQHYQQFGDTTPYYRMRVSLVLRG